MAGYISKNKLGNAAVKKKLKSNEILKNKF